MERDLEDIVKEGKEFYKLKKVDKTHSGEAGDEAFLVNREWLKAYKKYICFREIKSNSKPDVDPDHC